MMKFARAATAATACAAAAAGTLLTSGAATAEPSDEGPAATPITKVTSEEYQVLRQRGFSQEKISVDTVWTSEQQVMGRSKPISSGFPTRKDRRIWKKRGKPGLDVPLSGEQKRKLETFTENDGNSTSCFVISPKRIFCNESEFSLLGTFGLLDLSTDTTKLKRQLSIRGNKRVPRKERAEYIFFRVYEAIDSPLVSPELRAAMIDVLEGLGEFRFSDSADGRGREALRITYRRPAMTIRVGADRRKFRQPARNFQIFADPDSLEALELRVVKLEDEESWHGKLPAIEYSKVFLTRGEVASFPARAAELAEIRDGSIDARSRIDARYAQKLPRALKLKLEEKGYSWTPATNQDRDEAGDADDSFSELWGDVDRKLPFAYAYTRVGRFNGPGSDDRLAFLFHKFSPRDGSKRGGGWIGADGGKRKRNPLKDPIATYVFDIETGETLLKIKYPDD